MSPARIFLSMAILVLFFVPGCADDTGAGEQEGDRSFETIERQAGEVQIKVTPAETGADAASWTFDVVLDTHTVPLDEDPAEAVFLLTDGREYPAQSWEGDPPGGHHRTGVLSFPAPRPAPQRFEIVMKELGGAETRFAWENKA